MQLRLIHLVLICFLLVGLYSCRQNEAEEAIYESGTMTLSLSVPGNQDKGYITYAMPLDEPRIEHIAVLVFKTDPADPANVAKGTFLYRAGVSYNGPNPANCIITVRQMSQAQTFVLIANARETVDNTPITEGEPKQTVIQKLLVSKPVAFDAATMSSIPMWGEVQNKVVNNGVIPTGLSCKLYRMLAKINVQVDAAIPATEFRLKTVHLYMPRQKGTLLPDNWGAYTSQEEATPPDEAVSIPTQPIAAGTVPAQATRYTYTTITDKIENIYCFEALNNTNPAIDPLDRCCLVVGGWYANDNTQEYYYRIDLKAGTTQLDILRNFIYNVTINSVGGMGVDNPEDAYKGLSVIEASVEPWNQATGDAQYGSSHLYVSQRYPWLKMDGTTEPFTGSRLLKIKTTDPAGWQWKNDATTQATLTTFNVTTTGGAANTEVTVAWSPANITTSQSTGRDGKAIVVSGNLEYTIFFMQDNCGRMGIALPRQIGTNTYKTHRYGTDCWMVENSKEGTYSARYYRNNSSYDNGAYYIWNQASTACPANWSLPDQTQWNALKTAVNADLSNTTAKWWAGTLGVANNAFAGYYNVSTSYWNLWGTGGYWWSSSAPYQCFYGGTAGMYGPYSNSGNWFSVRCLQ